MRVARICKQAFWELDGEGARIHGGRWNSPGISAVYLSSTQSLALLEVLVHVGSVDEFLETEFVCVTVAIPDKIVRFESPWWSAASRRSWANKQIAETRAVGDTWLTRYPDLVLAVPSVIVPDENNLLLHPVLGESGIADVETVASFSFDRRLLRRL